jgi:hypothetical protein
MRDERPTVVTHVARAAHGDNQFRGHWVNQALLGRQSMASMAALGVGGPLLDGEEREVLEELAVAVTVADPRIWPLKVTRIASAYGSMFAGLAAGNLTMDRSVLSMLACRPIATRLVELARVAADMSEPEFQVHVQRLWDERRPLGFGVPARDEDERVVGLVGRIRARGRHERTYFRLFERVVPIVRAARGLEPNLLLAFSAIALDLGFKPEAIGAMAWSTAQVAFQANAVEGAETAPEVLRRLPQAFLHYKGPAPRESPRARRQSGSA